MADFALHADEGPVFMLNLLKFDPVTKDGSMSGAESYAKYGQLAGPVVQKHGGIFNVARGPDSTTHW